MKINDSQNAFLLFFFIHRTISVVSRRWIMSAMHWLYLLPQPYCKLELWIRRKWLIVPTIVGLYTSYEHDITVTSRLIAWSISSWASLVAWTTFTLSQPACCQHGGKVNPARRFRTLPHRGIIQNNLERKKPQRKLPLISSPLISSPAGVLSNHRCTQPGYFLQNNTLLNSPHRTQCIAKHVESDHYFS